MLWAWPFGVVGAFDVPARVLAFDDSRVRAQAPLGQEAADQDADERGPAMLRLRVRGEGSRLSECLSGRAQRGGEADPVRVVAGVNGGVGHERADRVVAAEVSPDLLEDEVGRLGAEHGAGASLMGLQLVDQINAYRHDYNHVRPHETIAWNRPADVYAGTADPTIPNFETEEILPTT